MSLLTLTRRRTRLTLVIISLLLVASAASFACWNRKLRVEASARPVVTAGGLPTLRGEPAVEHLKQQGLYASLGEAVARTRYDLQRSEAKDLPARLKLDGEVWHAANPAQGLNAYFSRSGMKVTKRGAEKTGGELGLRVTGYGYGEQMMAVGAGEMRADGNRIEYTHPAISGTDSSLILHPSSLKEWYVNSQAGVEQGFTLDTAPGTKREGEALRVRMEVAGGWRAKLAESGQAVTLSGKCGERLRYAKLVAWDANKKPLKAWMEVEGQEMRLAVDDMGAAYPVTIDPTFSQQQKLNSSNRTAFDSFGNAVAISGDTAVVGAYHDTEGTNAQQGAAYVFVRNGTIWTQQAKLTASDGLVGDFFGSAVAISGDRIVVGAWGDNLGTFNNSDQGSAYVFMRSETTWTQQQKLLALSPDPIGHFGYSVAIAGETIVIGSPLDKVGPASKPGSAYVFVWNGAAWAQQQRLVPSDLVFSSGFGISVAISGETIVAGSWLDTVEANNGQGSAYVFVRTGTTWRQQKRLTASDGTFNDLFGVSVGISGDSIVVGAYLNGVASTVRPGAAYVFVRNGSDWTQQQKLTASDGIKGDQFGWSVAISGNTVVVGADLVNLGQGSAYTFVRSGNVWTQQDHLIASDGVLGNDFGYAVAIDSGIIVVGALNTSSGPAPAKRNHHGQLGGKPLLAHVLSAFARVLSVPCSHAPLGVCLRRQRP